MKKIKLIILTVILVFAFALTGCNFFTNNQEKEKKQNTNTPVNAPSNEDPEDPELELESDEIPLTLQAITAGKIILSGKDSFERISIQKGNTLIFDAADNIDVQPGDRIRFYGTNYKNDGTVNLTIQSTADCYVYGNVMSLLYYTKFADESEIPADYALQKLFLNNTHIKNHDTLDIILPATILSEGCYKKMFYGCTGLTRAPDLPAEILTQECYNSMFLGCKSLSSIKCLATNISATDCTKNWIVNVSDTGTFISAQENSIWFYKDKASGIPGGWISDPPCASVDAKELPLTIQAIEDCTIVIQNSSEFNNLQYSKNNGDKTGVTGNITVSAGDKVCFFAEGPEDDDTTSLSINCSGDCYLYGNIMSLIDPLNYNNLTILNKKNCFYELFKPINNSIDTHLKNCAIDLVLPAATLTESCYSGMFGKCSGLTVAPELPAETLAESCYSAMFLDCNGLTIAPELPATTLAPACYYKMFENCKGLTIAPAVLPAETLAVECYGQMFYNCENLINTPVLPAMSLQENCYHLMFYNCKNLTAAPKLPATELAKGCYKTMFGYCTKLTISPELEAVTLAPECYFNMFDNCTALTCAPAILPAKVLKESCYASMFYGCTELKAAPVLPAEELVTNCYQNMFSGCTNLHIIQCLAGSGTTNSQGLGGGLSTYGLLLCADTNNFSSGFPGGWKKVKEMPLTLEAIDAGDIKINNPNSFNSFQYLKNFEELQSVLYDASVTISVSAGDTIYLFASGHKSDNTNNLQIKCKDNNGYYVYGDLMSLDSYSDTISFSNVESKVGEFQELFKDNKYIKNHPSKKLILSAKTLKEYCYAGMFSGCSGLISAPELPAATLAEGCYKDMFLGCTGLTSAPDLTKATSLAENCYELMFCNCTGLTEAPKLTATTLAANCYAGMFSGCSGLISAPELPATTLAESCYQSMFADCASLKIAPELKASTLVTNCYQFMFIRCTSLQYIKCLATNGYTDENHYTNRWVEDVPMGGTFVRAGNSNWNTNNAGEHSIPIGWTVVDTQ